jgi:hypothetical protein
MKYFEVMMPDWLRPAMLLAVISAALWWVVLARGMGWMSPDSAAVLSAQREKTAVATYATPACVARFERQPGAVAMWQKLKKDKQDWGWADFIRSQKNLVSEPGQTLSSDLTEAIADSCATELRKLTSINGVKLI